MFCFLRIRSFIIPLCPRIHHSCLLLKIHHSVHTTSLERLEDKKKDVDLGPLIQKELRDIFYFSGLYNSSIIVVGIPVMSSKDFSGYLLYGMSGRRRVFRDAKNSGDKRSSLYSIPDGY